MTMLMTSLNRGTPGSSEVHTSKPPTTPSSLEWKKLPPCSLARQDAASNLIFENDDDDHDAKVIGIILVGGRSADEPSLSLVELFEWSSQRWWTLPPLTQERCGCAIASLNKTFYVIGGLGRNSERFASCESFTLRSGKEDWKEESSMPTPRWYPAAVSLPLHQDIVVVGGRDDSWQELASVEVYDTQAKQWQTLTPMTCPRFGCGATRVGPSKLLVAGGYNGKTWLESAEIFDYEADAWSTIANMPEALEFCIVTTLSDDHVLVTGRLEDKKGTPMFCYSISQNRWTSLRACSNIKGCAMVSVLGKLITIGGGTDEYGSRFTRVSTNLNSLLDDDHTVSTARSYSSNNIKDEDFVSAMTEEVKSQLPWWSTTDNNTKPKLVIPQHELDQISVLADDDFASTAPPYVVSESPTKRSNAARKGMGKRRLVEDEAMMDANGRKVIYTGSVSSAHSRPHGKGKMSWVVSGDFYNGSFRHGMRDGFGQMVYSTGDSFEGVFSKDKRHGQGLHRWGKDGRTFDGNYEHDVPHDPNGTMTWKDGTIYVGAFLKGNRSGKGIQRFPSGVRYQGDFVNGKYDGFGVCEFADGSIYKGHWVKGQAHGQGRLTNADGEVIHDGQWVYDGPVSR